MEAMGSEDDREKGSVGGSFEDFLRDEGRLEEATRIAKERVGREPAIR